MLKKTCAVLMSCLVLGTTTAPVWAADLEVPVKTVTSTQNKVTVECPQVVGGSKSADEKINRALSSQVASFVSEASTLGGGKVHYDVHKADGDVISFTIVMTPNMGVEESQGMTFDRKSGQLRPLSYYYTDDQLHVLAENGLKYLYDVDPSRLQTLPDTYYIDKDGSLIGLYHAGAVLDKSEGEIEVNLSAAGVDEDGNVVETPIAHPSDASATAVKQENHEEEVPAETGRGKGLANLQKRAAAREADRQKAAEEKARKEAEKQAAKEQAAKDEEQLDDDSQAKADISRLAAKYRAAKAADAKLDAQIAADQKAQLAQEAAAKKAAAEKAKRDAREKAEAEKTRARAAELRKEAAAAAKIAVEAKKETKPEAKAETPSKPMTVKEKVAMIQAEEARKEAEEEAARMKQLVAIREAAEKRAAEEKARQEAAARAAAEERARQEEARRQAEAEAEAQRQAEAERQAAAAEAARQAAVDYDTSGSGVITGTEVRMRSGAGTDYRVIGAFDNGETVQVLASAQADGATWYKVQRSDGSTGWVSADYCSLGSSSTGTISGTDVRMRASYSTDSDVLGYFDNGESVTILDDVTSNGQRWLKVQRSDGSVGWVAADFVAEG
ncbi:SH3 domain-containing protein [Acidaminococcus timonensis]|uniref:SH3 domain-containing protein n=1 Tax=Acidaminococcus timonensis TaxID=1871002 RepID=UPI00248B7F05|nr:SH3 domain-containing protein [Acidaminococcus timonensis]